MLRRNALGALAGSVFAGGLARAQQGTPIPGDIRVAVNEVIVPVTVTDDRGRFVSNLDQGDFRVYEDGKVQTIKYFNRERNQPEIGRAHV
mgnify:FL=1